MAGMFKCCGVHASLSARPDSTGGPVYPHDGSRWCWSGPFELSGGKPAGALTMLLAADMPKAVTYRDGHRSSRGRALCPGKVASGAVRPAIILNKREPQVTWRPGWLWRLSENGMNIYFGFFGGRLGGALRALAFLLSAGSCADVRCCVSHCI